ncbi:MAG: hypothetical protein ACREDH_11875, partial [Methylocella sp.]
MSATSRRPRPREDERRPVGSSPDEVETTSRESFPASDPPSWTPVTGTGIPIQDAMEDCAVITSTNVNAYARNPISRQRSAPSI